MKFCLKSRVDFFFLSKSNTEKILSAFIILKIMNRTAIYPGSFDPVTYGHIDIIKRATNIFDQVIVAVADNYLKNNVNVLIRGLRVISDFDYELQMALTNRRLNEKIETLFLMPSEGYSFLSSTLIKEASSLGADVSSFVPKSVEDKIKEKLKNLK